MASAPHASIAPPEQRPRVRMKPDASPSGVVDGAWWPRSHDLAEQLPALLTELWDRLGGVERVSYNLGAWPGAPRRISVSGHVVRLGGFRTQDPLSIDLIGDKAGRRITTLLVVPVEASPDAAEAALAASCDPDGAGTLRSMLESGGPSPTPDSAVPA
jgi:hypothetical protein